MTSPTLPSSAPRKCHIRRGDKIIVRSGKTKGKIGTVIKVFPDVQRALVDGDVCLNDIKHTKANPNTRQEGGRIPRMRPIHVSKLALLDPTTGKATRVKRERSEKGVVRVAKKSGHRFE